MSLEADPGNDAAAAEGAAPAEGLPGDPAGAPPTGSAADPGGDAAAAEGAAPAEGLPGDPAGAPPTGSAADPGGDAAAAEGAAPAGGPPEDPAGDQPLDPASVTAARLAGAIGVAAGALSGLVAVLVAVLATPLGGLRAAVLVAAVVTLAAAAAAACYQWPAVRYRHTRYRLDAHGVTIRRGVVWRTVTSVPTSRVQHTDVSRGPVERYFDLATLVIHTAGTRDASVALSGLGHRAALALRDRLIGAGGGRGV